MSATLSVNGKQVTVPEARKILQVPGGCCFGCWLGDDGPEMHDIPDACDYFGGFLYELPDSATTREP